MDALTQVRLDKSELRILFTGGTIRRQSAGSIVEIALTEAGIEAVDAALDAGIDLITAYKRQRHVG